jgi:hypothetical protein
MMESKKIFETLDYNAIFMQAITREDITAFSHCASFKTLFKNTLQYRF